jgi:hypothetical protein
LSRRRAFQRPALLLAQRFDVEAFGLGGAEELLDGPAQAIEADDPARVGGVVDGMGRQEPPMRGRLALRAIDLTRLDEVQLEAFRQRLAALAVLGPAVLGPADDDRAEAQGNHGLASFSGMAGNSIVIRPASGQAAAAANRREPFATRRSWLARTSFSTAAGLKAKHS